jgi:hypothetical protein
MMFRGSRGGGCAVTFLGGPGDNGVVEIHLTWNLRHPVWKSIIFDIQALVSKFIQLEIWFTEVGV